MRYPSEFPPEFRNRVEAEKIRAGRDFDSEKQASRWTSDVEANLRHYILRTFLAFANEARDLRLWPVDEMDSNCREFLRLLTIDAYFEKGYDKAGGRLTDMTSNWNGAILSEVEREFMNTSEWRQYQDVLLEVAEASPKANSVATANQRAVINTFIAKVTESGRRITRKNIWTVAGYKDATEFQRFQRGDARTTSSAATTFSRVLKMKPKAFIESLEKKREHK